MVRVGRRGAMLTSGDRREKGVRGRWGAHQDQNSIADRLGERENDAGELASGGYYLCYHPKSAHHGLCHWHHRYQHCQGNHPILE